MIFYCNLFHAKLTKKFTKKENAEILICEQNIEKLIYVMRDWKPSIIEKMDKIKFI